MQRQHTPTPKTPQASSASNPNRADLAKQASAILRRAGCDALTGAKQKNRDYRRNKRAEHELAARHWRKRQKQFGKFGPASPVRMIEVTREGEDDLSR
jgi:hypothetical protein